MSRDVQRKHLTEGEFRATFTNPMKPLGSTARPLFDYWPYFDGIPEGDFGGVACATRRVVDVY